MTFLLSAIEFFLFQPNPEISEIFEEKTCHIPCFKFPESSIIRQPWVRRVRWHKKWVIF